MRLDTESALMRALGQLSPPSAGAMELAQRRWDAIAKPLHGLGRLEAAVTQLAGILDTPQVELSQKGVAVFCADNGVVAEGVSQTSQQVTAVVTENLTRGDASVCQMARVAGARVIPVDIGVAVPVSGPGLRVHKVRPGTASILRGPAMTRGEALEAVLYGVRLAGELKEAGYGIVATGEMGIGNTTTSSAVLSALLGLPAEQVTGLGAGLSPQALRRKVEVVREAVAHNRPNPADPLDVLSKVGGLDLAGMMGLCLGGALHRLPVVLDGLISTAAALLAVGLCPAVNGYLLPSHLPKERAGVLALERLGKQPLLCCELCLGEGTGAVALFPLLEMALAVYRGMRTFQEIEIEEYRPFPQREEDGI